MDEFISVHHLPPLSIRLVIENLATNSVFKLIMKRSDHGLFFPPDDSIQRKGQWLLPQKTLLYYGLKTGVSH